MKRLLYLGVIACLAGSAGAIDKKLGGGTQLGGTTRSMPTPVSPAAKAAAVAAAAATQPVAYAKTTVNPGDPLAADLNPKGGKLDLIWIKPGEFLMGSTSEERDWAAGKEGQAPADVVKDEGAQPRKAIIKDGYYLGRTEVTIGQWKTFADTGYKSKAEKDGHANCFNWKQADWGNVGGKNYLDPNYGFTVASDHPVTCVNWEDAKAFCNWLTRREASAGRLPQGYVYRLPTEAEWEFACRAGQESQRFWWGNGVDDGKGKANICGVDRIDRKLLGIAYEQDQWPATFPYEDGYAWVSPVGKFGANAWGLCDMIGNVWEWCLDYYDATGAHEDLHRAAGDFVVLRGGGFDSMPGRARCAERNRDYPGAAASRYGFRVCVGLPK